MLDSTFVLFRPSEIACSTYIVSAQIVGKKELWVHYFGYCKPFYNLFLESEP